MAQTRISGGNYTYVTASSNSGGMLQIVNGAGTLHTVTLNKILANPIKLIDGVSGSTANIGTISTGGSSILPGTYTYDVQFGVGLRIVTTAAEDITLCWYQN